MIILRKNQIPNPKYCRPAVSNEIIPATKQEGVFSSKVASVQSITDIALLDYGLMLLP